MNFDFSDEQKSLKEQARKFLSEKCSTKVVRKAFESTSTFDQELWQQVCEMGWTATAIPESHGGLGLGYLELCVIAEEMGRALAPIPFSSSIYLFAEAVLQFGNEQQKQRFLPKVATGEVIGTFARAEAVGPVLKSQVKTTFKAGKLNGNKLAVVDGAAANHAVVLAQAENGLQLVLVSLTEAGVTRDPCESLDGSRAHANITFKNTNAEAIGEAGDGWQQTNHILDRAAVLIAFEQVGGSDACLEMAKNYAMKRYAFGRPIGSFQAIKHKLADMYILNELARSNAYYGAWALSTNASELALAASSARVCATQAYDYAAKENIQTHGGIGFTWEADCHFYAKRSKELGLLLGSQRTWKDKLVSELEKGN